LAIIKKPPEQHRWDEQISVFLAGTIDNGAGVNWQTHAESVLLDLDVQILNPRRDEWDASWKQSISNPKFREQVEWELEGLEKATSIFMFFAGKSQSPITLMELGLVAEKKNLVVVAERDFWRRGNIEVIANKYKIRLFDRLEEGLQELRKQIIKNQ